MIGINQLQHLAVTLRNMITDFNSSDQMVFCISGSAKNSDSSNKFAHGNAMKNYSFAFVSTHIM